MSFRVYATCDIGKEALDRPVTLATMSILCRALIESRYASRISANCRIQNGLAVRRTLGCLMIEILARRTATG